MCLSIVGWLPDPLSTDHRPSDWERALQDKCIRVRGHLVRCGPFHVSVCWVIWGLRKILSLVHWIAHALCNSLQPNSWTHVFIAIKICHKPNHLWGANSANVPMQKAVIKNTENEDERSLNNNLEFIYSTSWGMRGKVFHVGWREATARAAEIEDHYHYARESHSVEWIRVTTVGPLLEKLQLWIIMC